MRKLLLIFISLMLLIIQSDSELEDHQITESKLIIERKAMTGRKGTRKMNENRKKKNKHRKKRKNSKNNRKGKITKKNRKSKTPRGHGRFLKDKCLEEAVTALQRWKNQVANFQKQHSRVNKQSEIAYKKSTKQNLFKAIALKLIDIGGGNKSALTCSGFSDSNGAKQLANLTKTLEECRQKINDSCSPDNFPKADMTLVNDCDDTVNDFVEEAQNCLDLSTENTAEEACGCWTGYDMIQYSEKVKICKIKEAGEIAKGLKKCKIEFSKCRQFEDAAIDTVHICSKSEDQHLSDIETLSKIKDSLNNIKAKITKAETNAMAPATDCKELLALVLKGKFLIFL